MITHSNDRYHAVVQISQAAVALSVTVGIAGTSYAAFNSDTLTHRAVDTAIVQYVARHGVAPAGIDEIKQDIRGDVSAYRIVNGQAAGPGCAA